MSIVQSVIETVAERAGDARVLRVTRQIGRLSAVLPDAVRFCFEVAREGTALEGAELAIVQTEGLARCRGCGAEVRASDPLAQCACGGCDLEWLAGHELLIRSMEVQ